MCACWAHASACKRIQGCLVAWGAALPAGTIRKKIISSAPPFGDVSKEVESEYIRYQGEQMLDEYLEDLRNWYDVVKANEL